MRVISIIGLVDSGKSSLIRVLLDAVHSRGECGGVVINDTGAVSLDVPEITDRHPVRTIGGGWIGCNEAGSFQKAIKSMARDDGVSVLFAEPSGIVIPFELRTAISAAGRDVPVTVGPVVLLLNGSEREMLFGEGLGHITAQQITQADVVAITKIDSALDTEILRVEKEVARLAPQTDPHHVSMQSGEGVAALVESILGPMS